MYSKVINNVELVCKILVDFYILAIGCLHYILVQFVIVQKVIRIQMVVITFAHKLSKDCRI